MGSTPIGIDIVHIPEFADSAESEAFLEKVFHQKELGRMERAHLAGLFAAKEAIMKAAGLAPGSWLEIEITADGGRPTASLLHSAMPLEISIAHHGEYAIAICLAQIENEK